MQPNGVPLAELINEEGFVAVSSVFLGLLLGLPLLRGGGSRNPYKNNGNSS